MYVISSVVWGETEFMRIRFYSKEKKAKEGKKEREVWMAYVISGAISQKVAPTLRDIVNLHWRADFGEFSDYLGVISQKAAPTLRDLVNLLAN